jgi:hypothetical protein
MIVTEPFRGGEQFDNLISDFFRRARSVIGLTMCSVTSSEASSTVAPASNALLRLSTCSRVTPILPYSSAMAAVLAYLYKVDPEGAKRARYRYSCFDQFGENTQAYGYAVSLGLGSPANTRRSVNSLSCAVTQLSMRAAMAASPLTALGSMPVPRT